MAKDDDKKKITPKITSAAKRLRNSKCANIRNRARSSELRTMEKKFRTAIEAQDTELATSLLKEVTSKLDKAVKAHTVHCNKVANKKSQLDKLMNSLKA